MKHTIKIKVTPTGWRGIVKAASAARSAETAADAFTNTCRANVVLIPEQWRKPLVQAESKLRAYVYGNTLPYQDGGWRLIASENKEQFEAGLQPLVTAFKDAGRDIENSQEQIDRENKGNAEKKNGRLGKWSEEWQVSKHLAKHAGYNVEVSSDIIGDPRQDEFCKQNEAMLKQALDSQKQSLKAAVADLPERVVEILDSVRNKINALAKGEDVKWGALRSQVKDTAQAIKNLNIMEDPALDTIAAELEAWKLDQAPDVANISKLLGLQVAGQAQVAVPVPIKSVEAKAVANRLKKQVAAATKPTVKAVETPAVKPAVKGLANMMGI